MLVLIIIYELIDPAVNGERVVASIKSSQEWAKMPGSSSYIVCTNESPVQLRDRLKQMLMPGDKLWVGVAPAPSAWAGLPDDLARWILNHQLPPTTLGVA